VSVQSEQSGASVIERKIVRGDGSAIGKEKAASLPDLMPNQMQKDWTSLITRQASLAVREQPALARVVPDERENQPKMLRGGAGDVRENEVSVLIVIVKEIVSNAVVSARQSVKEVKFQTKIETARGNVNVSVVLAQPAQVPNMERMMTAR